MTIPAYTNDGILPPFLGSTPGGASGLMSPYKVSVVEVVEHFATSRERIAILNGWLAHRAALRDLGFNIGFQWLDGSFVEDKTPKDLDVVTFVYFGAPCFVDPNRAWELHDRNQVIFDRTAVKDAFALDSFFIDLLDPPEFVIDVSRYLLGLFSHQRITMMWKGMLQVRLEDAEDDAEALVILQERDEALPPLPSALATNLLLFDAGGPANAS